MRREPYYVQIQNYILRQIRDGLLKPDDQVPSENQLSKIFGVSRITSSMAVKQLAQQGYVYRRRGKGTFVLGNRRDQQVTAAQMPCVFESSAPNSPDSCHKTYDVRAVPASDEVAKLLELRPGEDVNQVIRIKYMADSPVCCEMTYFPKEIIGALSRDDLPDDMSIHAYLRGEKGLNIRRNKIYLESITAGIFEADRLNVEVGESLLMLEHILFDQCDKPASFSRLIVNTKSYQLSLEFSALISLTVGNLD